MVVYVIESHTHTHTHTRTHDCLNDLKRGGQQKLREVADLRALQIDSLSPLLPDLFLLRPYN